MEPPYKWSVFGSPSEGSASEEATGVSAGTPNRHDDGTYTLTVKVVDKKIKAKHQHVTQNTATKVLSITIS